MSTVPMLAIPMGRSYDLLIESTLKALNKDEFPVFGHQASAILSKKELVALVQAFGPEDTIELFLILQHVIGFLWSNEKLFLGQNFEPFANFSLRATDLLIKYKSMKYRKILKNDIPHEPSFSD